MSEEITRYKCDHVGVASTTDVHVKKLPDGRFEARCGNALMGTTYDSDLFNELFDHNYNSGIGATEDDALEALRNDIRSLANSQWVVYRANRRHRHRLTPGYFW